jgi:cytochrome b
MPEQTNGIQSRRRPFNPLAAVMIVAILLWAVMLGSGWYAENVLMQRYCGDVPGTMRLLEDVLTEKRPAGANSRVPHLIAAKILYLQPQRSAESIPAYLKRMRLHLQHSCYGTANLFVTE